MTDARALRLVHAARMEVTPTPQLEPQLAGLRLGDRITVACPLRPGLTAAVDLARRLALRGVDVMPHLPARMVRDRKHLRGIVATLGAAGVSGVLVTRGETPWPQGPYASAAALLTELATLDHEIADIAVEAFPTQPLAASRELWERLAAPGTPATRIVTHPCLDADELVTWLRRTRRAGIALPAVVGVPGPITRAGLQHIALNLGNGASIRYRYAQHAMLREALRTDRFEPTMFLEQLARLADAPETCFDDVQLVTHNELAACLSWRAHQPRPIPMSSNAVQRRVRRVA